MNSTSTKGNRKYFLSYFFILGFFISLVRMESVVAGSVHEYYQLPVANKVELVYSAIQKYQKEISRLAFSSSEICRHIPAVLNFSLINKIALIFFNCLMLYRLKSAWKDLSHPAELLRVLSRSNISHKSIDENYPEKC